MNNSAENLDEQRVLSVKVPLALWERITREAHRRSLETGRHVSATAVIRSAVAAGLGADPVAVNDRRQRKATTHRVVSTRVRTRPGATGCTAAGG